MRVYVASRLSDEGIANVREMYRLLKEAGHEITLDWTVETAEGKGGKELEDYLIDCAERDLDAVRRADALIFIHIENVQMRGAYIEAGAALGLGKPVIVVHASPGTLNMPGSCIFFMPSWVQKAETKEEAIKLLGRYELPRRDCGCYDRS
jgi:hypothetical protein